MKTILQLFTKYKFLILVILFTLLSVGDLSHYGLPPTQDGEYHVMRFWQFYKALSYGIVYPRWAADFNNGFGVPLFNYVYPLPNYIASFFHLLGFSFIDSFKLNMAAATVFGAIFFYLWAKKYWGEVGGMVSAIFYTFSPYHLLDIYVRGSVGEVWSLALAPALLWSYLNFCEGKKYEYFALSSIFLALLIYAHNILAVVFFGFFILYAGVLYIWKIGKVRSLWSFIIIIFCGFGLAAPFWLPAILETQFVAGLQIFNPTDYFPVVYKLIYSSWGYGFSGAGIKDQMSTQIGIADLFAVLESFFVYLFLKRSKNSEIKQHEKIVIFMTIVLLVTTFLITPYSAFLWKIVKPASFIQFPWRLLSVVILCASFLAGFLCWDVLYKKHKRLQYLIAILLIGISIGLSIRYDKAPFYHARNDAYYLARSNFTDGTNSPGNLFNTKWLKSVPPKRKERINILDGQGSISNLNIKPTRYTFSVNTQKPSEIVIHTAYFPGWQAQVNGKNEEIKNIEGRIVIKVNKGSSNVEVWLGNTNVQNLSYIYFWISIVLLVFLTIKTDIIKT